MNHLIEVISRSRLGHYLNSSQIACLAESMDIHEVPADASILLEGAPANFIGLVLSGEAEVIHEGIRVGTIPGGIFFGESMFSDEPIRTASIRATSQMTYATLAIDAFEKLLEEHRAVALLCKAFLEALYRSNADKRLGDQKRYVALIAHNQMKPVLVEFATTYRKVLDKYDLIATGTTGSLLYNSTGLQLSRKVQSGPLGGDQAIGSLIASGNIRAVIFFRDPLSAHPHHADIEALGRLCDVYYVPFATNPVTAEAVLSQLEHGIEPRFSNPSFEKYVSGQSTFART